MPTASLAIAPVRTDADIASVAALVWEFFGFLRKRYPGRQQMIDTYIAVQDVAGQLADFATHFNPPAGECLLAKLDGAPVGIVMLKPERPGTCEMNRMYVDPVARGRGVGLALCTALLAEARRLGYRDIRLDAVDGHIEALPLCRKLGFRPDHDPPEFARSDPSIVSLRMPL